MQNKINASFQKIKAYKIYKSHDKGHNKIVESECVTHHFER